VTASPALTAALQRAWLGRGPLACALWPVSLLYRALTALRAGLYRWGVFKTVRLPVPVIVVGSPVVGGSGKTPVTLALARYVAQQGVAVGIVSRGYGRAATVRSGSAGRAADAVIEVTPASTAAEVGDEPLLMHRTLAGQGLVVPVFVGRARAQAARALLAAHPGVQVLLCDDGLQHLALARDLDVVVFDKRGLGNGWLLPAGLLRQPWPRSRPRGADDGADQGAREGSIQAADEGAAGVACQLVLGLGNWVPERRLADHAVNAAGQTIALSALQGQPLAALAGIAQPQLFFDMLRARDLQLASTLALPDHYNFYSKQSLFHLDIPLICTEKDAVKLWLTQPDAWAVPLVLSLPPDFYGALDQKLSSLLRDYPPTTSGAPADSPPPSPATHSPRAPQAT
jgi:tetraacyldisaccharide 4'-kinase